MIPEKFTKEWWIIQGNRTGKRRTFEAWFTYQGYEEMMMARFPTPKVKDMSTIKKEQAPSNAGATGGTSEQGQMNKPVNKKKK